MITIDTNVVLTRSTFNKQLRRNYFGERKIYFTKSVPLSIVHKPNYAAGSTQRNFLNFCVVNTDLINGYA